MLKAKQLWKRLNRKVDEETEGSCAILEVRVQCCVPMISLQSVDTTNTRRLNRDGFTSGERSRHHGRNDGVLCSRSCAFRRAEREMLRILAV
jgi:hypothetical protein